MTTPRRSSPLRPSEHRRGDPGMRGLAATILLAVLLGIVFARRLARPLRAARDAAYLMATGGAAYLVARAIKEARVVAFEDLGMEAIYEFTVENMPVTVAVDAAGNNVHKLAPAQWKKRIAEEHLLA